MPAATQRLPRQTIRSRIARLLEVPGKDGKSSPNNPLRKAFFSPVPDKLRNRKLGPQTGRDQLLVPFKYVVNECAHSFREN